MGSAVTIGQPFTYASVTYVGVTARVCWFNSQVGILSCARAAEPCARRIHVRMGTMLAGTESPPVRDGVIGSPPAFGAVQSRFESESLSTVVGRDKLRT